MIKTDELYLENLSEFIYDDKKVVTYKFLSVFLGVHVNLAKQMLYTFYEREKKNGKKLYAVFYVSGLAKEKINLKDDKSSSSQEEDEYDRHVVLLCRDSDLDEVKEKFSKLFSVHIYSLSSHPINDYAALQPTVDKSVLNDEGRSPADFGPFSCAAEVRPEKCKALVTEPVQQKVSSDNGRKLADRPAESSKPVLNSKTLNKPKNIFGTQASTDKNSSNKKSTSVPHQSSIQSSFSKTKVVPKSEKPVETKASQAKGKVEISKPAVSNSKKKQDSKSKSVSKNRKRIRVDSDSDSEDGGHSSKKRASVFTSSDEDDDDSRDNLEGSPKRNSLRRIDSDSEEEDVKLIPSSPGAKKAVSPVEAKQVSSNGRRRVVKTVTRTFKDEEGYDVTEKVQEVVSEADDDIEETAMDVDVKEEGIARNGVQENANAKPADVVVKAEPKQQKTSSVPTEKTSASSRNASSTKSKSTSGSQSKTKQPGIMSFFQKK